MVCHNIMCIPLLGPYIGLFSNFLLIVTMDMLDRVKTCQAHV